MTIENGIKKNGIDQNQKWLTEIDPEIACSGLTEKESIYSVWRDLFHPKNVPKNIKGNEQR